MTTFDTVENAAREADEATRRTSRARAARDQAIRDARAAGARPVDLAAASGLGRSTVHAALRAAPGNPPEGEPLAYVERAAQAWREADEAEGEAHEARNIAIAQALDGGELQPADVRRATGWGEARVYQARDLGRDALAKRG